MIRPPPTPPLFPYATLFRPRAGLSLPRRSRHSSPGPSRYGNRDRTPRPDPQRLAGGNRDADETSRGCVTPVARIVRGSEEHTSELHSPDHLVCRLLLEKKNT